MRILITGGAGYVGSRLVPALLEDGYEVIVYDTLWFGYYLPSTANENLHVIEADIRDTEHFAACCRYADAVIHLACISNDPSFELDESLSRTINFEAFEPMVLAAKKAGVKRFIYCSTSSVYGISDSPDVTEEHPLVPLTLYNTYKAQCEPLLLKHIEGDFEGVIIRPSTVCGWSPRLRLDLSVNILTHLAIAKRKITVFGGQQMRPNLHIEDMVDVYRMLLEAPRYEVNRQIFNVGMGNYSIARLAEIVRDEVLKQRPDLAPIEIETTSSMDTRSYQVNSDKIARICGYRPKRTVQDAVKDLCDAFTAGKVPNSLEDDRYCNVRQMRKIWKELYADAPPSAMDHTQGVMSEIDLIRQRAV